MVKIVCGMLSALLLASSAFAQVNPDVIYGDDDRLDIYQVQSGMLRQLADSTVGLIKGYKITVEGEKAAIQTTSYSQSYNLCEDEPFYEQETAAFCSGSLVGPDLVMTAGHCITSQYACESTKFALREPLYPKHSDFHRHRSPLFPVCFAAPED